MGGADTGGSVFCSGLGGRALSWGFPVPPPASGLAPEACPVPSDGWGAEGTAVGGRVSSGVPLSSEDGSAWGEGGAGSSSASGGAVSGPMEGPAWAAGESAAGAGPQPAKSIPAAAMAATEAKNNRTMRLLTVISSLFRMKRIRVPDECSTIFLGVQGQKPAAALCRRKFFPPALPLLPTVRPV